MADENKVVNNEQKPVEHQYSDAEQQAMAQGWVPQEEWTGTGKWRSAEDFLDRGELFAKIEDQGRQLKGMKAQTQALATHLELVRKTEYNRALAQLRAEKKTALAEGDADAVVDVEERIEAAKAEFTEAEIKHQMQARQADASTQYNPLLQVWVNRNPWYNTDKAMRIYADQIGHELAAQGLVNPQEILVEVERRTKKEFAERFNNPNRNKPGAVEAGGNKGGQGKDSFQLTDEETRVMNRFIKAGLLTKEQYIADIKADRGV